MWNLVTEDESGVLEDEWLLLETIELFPDMESFLGRVDESTKGSCEFCDGLVIVVGETIRICVMFLLLSCDIVFSVVI